MVSLLLAAAALWCWPSRPRAPLAPRAGGGSTGRRRPVRIPIPLVAIGMSVLLLVSVTPAAGVAGGLLTATVLAMARSERAQARHRRELGAAVTVVRMLAREVRAGIDPASAVAAVGRVSGGAGPAVLAGLQSAILTNDRPDDRSRRPDLSEPAQRLVTSWRLASRHGVSWAAVLDALVVDLAAREQATASLAAQAAGPRMSGYVLAALPVLGIALGAGMGADPAGVLLGPGVGGLLLVVGTALTCAGLVWTRRIVRA